jgi:hypothetical protein
MHDEIADRKSAATGMGLVSNVDPVQAFVTSPNRSRGALKVFVAENPRKYSYKMPDIGIEGTGCTIGDTHV